MKGVNSVLTGLFVVLIFCTVSFAILPPAIPKDLLESALSRAHGEEQASRLVQHMTEHTERVTTRNLDSLSEEDFLDLLKTLNVYWKDLETIGAQEWVDRMPQLGWETRAPLSFTLPVYLLINGLTGPAVLHGQGTYSSTFECRHNWCLFLNRRETAWAGVPPGYVGNFTDLPHAPPVYDNALFALKKDGSMVGFDLALAQSGRYVGDNYGQSLFGANTNLPTFVSARNPRGTGSVDNFGTKPGFGGDSSRGSNQYIPLDHIAPTPENPNPIELKIYSDSYVVDPFSNDFLLRGEFYAERRMATPAA